MSASREPRPWVRLRRTTRSSSAETLLELADLLHDMALDRERRPLLFHASAKALAAHHVLPLASDVLGLVADLLESARAVAGRMSEAERDADANAAALVAAGITLLVTDASKTGPRAGALADDPLPQTTSGATVADRHDHLSGCPPPPRRPVPVPVARLEVFRDPVLGTTQTFVAVPDRREPASPLSEAIARTLRLTPAEARLCARLMTGISLKEAASALGVRMTTVRTQLRSVFGKTGTTRQAELMRYLASLPCAPSDRLGAEPRRRPRR